jgi:hypothetical protein
MATPSREVLWERFRAFLGQWGEVRDSPYGLQLTWGSRVTEVELTQSQLHEYVKDFVGRRTELGLDDGLGNGLPLPLTDSFGDCFGPQAGPYARVALEGLDFRVVAN